MSDCANTQRFHQKPIADKQVQTLAGIAQGLLADGVLCDAEISFLQKWLVANTAVRSNAVLSIFIERVDRILKNSPVDEEERAELVSLLEELCANDFEVGELVKSTRLPLCNPAPPVDFSGKRFCFTGTFNFGTRKECESAILFKGATAGPLVKATDYLVIGSYVTASWKQEKFGRKIEKAIEQREKFGNTAIISEHHWEQAMR